MRFGLKKTAYEISNDVYGFQFKLGDVKSWGYHAPLLSFFAFYGV